MYIIFHLEKRSLILARSEDESFHLDLFIGARCPIRNLHNCAAQHASEHIYPISYLA